MTRWAGRARCATRKAGAPGAALMRRSRKPIARASRGRRLPAFRESDAINIRTRSAFVRMNDSHQAHADLARRGLLKNDEETLRVLIVRDIVKAAAVP